MTWVLFVPHFALVLLLVLLAVNENLTRSVDIGIDDGPWFMRAVYFTGGVLWYSIFLLVARFTQAWDLLGSAPGRAAGVSVVTTVFVLALGATSGGGMPSFNVQDLLVMIPGMTGVQLAQGLRFVSQRPDLGRCDPRTWSTRNRQGETRSVRWAGFSSDGRVLLLIEVGIDGGLFPSQRELALVALRPDGSLDDAFAARWHGPFTGWVTVQSDRVVVGRGAQITEILASDGSARPAEEVGRLTAGLAAFAGHEVVVGSDPGIIVVQRGVSGGVDVGVFDISGREARLVGRATVEHPDGVAAHGVLADGDAALIVAGAAGAADTVVRHRADGQADPGFRFRVLPSASDRPEDAALRIRALARVAGKPLVFLKLSDRDHLAFIGPDGTVDTAAGFTVKRDRSWDLRASAIQPLEDGRLAVVLEPGSEGLLAVLRAETTGELDEGAFDFPVGESRTTKPRTLYRFANRIVATGARGEILVRDAGQLALHDLAAAGRRRLHAPPWIESGRYR